MSELHAPVADAAAELPDLAAADTLALFEAALDVLAGIDQGRLCTAAAAAHLAKAAALSLSTALADLEDSGDPQREFEIYSARVAEGFPGLIDRIEQSRTGS